MNNIDDDGDDDDEIAVATRVCACMVAATATTFSAVLILMDTWYNVEQREAYTTRTTGRHYINGNPELGTTTFSGTSNVSTAHPLTSCGSVIRSIPGARFVLRRGVF